LTGYLIRSIAGHRSIIVRNILGSVTPDLVVDEAGVEFQDLASIRPKDLRADEHVEVMIDDAVPVGICGVVARWALELFLRNI